jgi:hypothetical protein
LRYACEEISDFANSGEITKDAIAQVRARAAARVRDAAGAGAIIRVAAEL